jgi:hypothetical protein
MGVRPFFQRVRDLTFWHDRVDFMKAGPVAADVRRKLPRDLYFFPGKEKPEICWGTNLTESRYYS